MWNMLLHVFHSSTRDDDVKSCFRVYPVSLLVLRSGERRGGSKLARFSECSYITACMLRDRRFNVQVQVLKVRIWFPAHPDTLRSSVTLKETQAACQQIISRHTEGGKTHKQD